MNRQYLCPVCKSTQRIEMKIGVGWIDHLRISLIVTAIASLAYWMGGQQPAVKSIVIYLPIWALWELIHWSHVRSQVKCQVCGFDAFLYLKDVKSARSVVEKRLQATSDDLRKKLEEKKVSVAQRNTSQELPPPS